MEEEQNNNNNNNNQITNQTTNQITNQTTNQINDLNNNNDSLHQLELYSNNNNSSLDSLSILSELASSVQPQTQLNLQSTTTLSDDAFHALLLASLCHHPSSPTIQNQPPNKTSQPQSNSSSSNSSSNSNSPNHALLPPDMDSNHSCSESHSPRIQLTLLSQVSSQPPLPPPPPPSSTTNPSHSRSHTQHQHAQDLLCALSQLQSSTPPTLHHTPFGHPQHPQEELDFDDPNLFSPFEPEHDQLKPIQDTRLLSAELDFLLGTQSFDPTPPHPSSSRPQHKLYSNSFSSFHQHHQHQASDQIDHGNINQLGIYTSSSNYPYDTNDQPDLSFLFGNQLQPQLPQRAVETSLQGTPDPISSSEEVEHYQTQYEEEMIQTEDLLNRLDHGIKMNQDHRRLKTLDSLIESSLTHNQIYLKLIKSTLDKLTLRQQEAHKFLTTSKKCLHEIQQQEKQKQRQNQNQTESNSILGATIKKVTNRQTPANSIHNSSTNNNGNNSNSEKDLNLVSNQIRSVSLPWFKHEFGVDLPTFEDGKKRDQYNSLLHQQPWQPPERRKLDDEVGHALRANKEDKNLINWDVIARNFPDRTPIECKIQWTQKQDPSINKSKWTPIEIDRLFDIVKKFDFQNWNLISNELGTGRTPSDCVKQFRSVTQEKRDWTETDDQLLKEGVSTYGQNWQAVAKHCGRSSNQCINRWSKTLRPDIKKGKWDPIEDEALKNAVAAVGMVWKDVAPRVRGRTDAQCRERWCNILDPRIVVGNWSNEEDERILRMRDLEGKTWSEISKSFNGRRTDNHCMRRHSELKRAKESKAARKSITTNVQQSQPTKIRIITHVAHDENYRNNNNAHSTSIPIPQNTLGRVLIPTDDGFSTRRSNNNLTSISLPSPTLCSDSKLDHVLASQNQPVSPLNHIEPIVSHINTTTTSTNTHMNANTNKDSNKNNNNNMNLNLRNPSSRLRSTNKRIKYSS